MPAKETTQYGMAAYLKEVALVVEVDAQQVVGVHGKRPVLHGLQSTYHHGGHSVASAGVGPRRAQRNSHHVEVDHIVDLEPDGLPAIPQTHCIASAVFHSWLVLLGSVLQ